LLEVFRDCGWKSVETVAGSLEKASWQGVKTAAYEQSLDIPEPVEKKQWKTRGNRNKSRIGRNTAARWEQ
jgi:hypothetical protein